MQTSCAAPALNASDLFGRELNSILDGSRPIEFHFQPVVDLQEGVAVGYEALVRFGGPLRWSPDRWFLAAAQLGRRADLESLVLRRSLEAIDRLPSNTFLSINVGPDFLISSGWDRIVDSRDSLARLVVEITEQDVIQDYRLVQRKIAAIRARGGTVATDDVGAGYASLRHVMEIRPDFVKLDRGFIEGCHRDSARAAMIEMLGTIAGRLDAWIIAEGIEVRGELEQLIRLEVPLAQGYYLGRPDGQMSDVALDAQCDIRTMATAGADTASIRRMVVGCPASTSAVQGMETIARDPELTVVMVIDSFRRPMMLIQKHPLVGMRQITNLMKVQTDSRLNEVMQRALARPPALRFDPLVAIDQRGEFLGLVEVDRMMSHTLHKTGQVLPMRSHPQPAPVLLRPGATRINPNSSPQSHSDKLEE